MFKKHVLWVPLFLSIVFVGFLFSLANAQVTVLEKKKYGGTLIMATPEDPRSLDGRYLGESASSNEGYQHIYERLVDYSSVGSREVIPLLATGWKRLDELNWLVYLRKGVKFHNGKELTAQDIWQNLDWKLNSGKYAKEKGWKPPRGKTTGTSQIKKMEVVDKYTLKINLIRPYPPFVNDLLNWMIRGVIDPEVVEKYGKEATLHPIGTGPFKYAEWVPGSHIILERFEDYWGEKAYLDKVIFRIIPDGQTRLIALQKGEVDIAEVPLTAVSFLQKDPKLTFFKVEDVTRRTGILYFNQRRWPMNQLKFRQAIAMGVDWVNMAKIAFPRDTFTPCRSFLKGSWAENPEAEKLLPPYNPTKAKELLKEVENEAGKPIPKEIDAVTRKSTGDILGNTLILGAEQLKKIGINLVVKVLEHEVEKSVVRMSINPNWSILLHSVKGPGIDPNSQAKEFLSTNPSAGDGKNIPAYANSRYDELYIKASSETEREKRKKIYQEMEKISLKDLVGLPIFNLPYVYGLNKRVHGYKPHDSGFFFIKSSWNNVWVEK